MPNVSPTRLPDGTVQYAGLWFDGPAFADWASEARRADLHKYDKVKRADKNGVMRTLYVKKAAAEAATKSAAPDPGPAETPAPPEAVASASVALKGGPELTLDRLKSLRGDLQSLSTPQLEALAGEHATPADRKAELVGRLLKAADRKYEAGRREALAKAQPAPKATPAPTDLGEAAAAVVTGGKRYPPPSFDSRDAAPAAGPSRLRRLRGRVADALTRFGEQLPEIV